MARAVDECRGPAVIVLAGDVFDLRDQVGARSPGGIGSLTGNVSQFLTSPNAQDAITKLGGDPAKINPLVPVHLVIDHSVMVDEFGTPKAFADNVDLEYSRNFERYEFLKWGSKALDNFQVVPPGTGICHQVNLEYLAQTVWTQTIDGKEIAYPDTLVGTDSHTTMVNGLSVLGWGVGGIEAEAAMRGQPISMLIPEVVGVKMIGKLREGVTATDLVLTVTQLLRKA